MNNGLYSKLKTSLYIDVKISKANKESVITPYNNKNQISSFSLNKPSTSSKMGVISLKTRNMQTSNTVKVDLSSYKSNKRLKLQKSYESVNFY